MDRFSGRRLSQPSASSNESADNNQEEKEGRVSYDQRRGTLELGLASTLPGMAGLNQLLALQRLSQATATLEAPSLQPQATQLNALQAYISNTQRAREVAAVTQQLEARRLLVALQLQQQQQQQRRQSLLRQLGLAGFESSSNLAALLPVVAQAERQRTNPSLYPNSSIPDSIASLSDRNIVAAQTSRLLQEVERLRQENQRLLQIQGRSHPGSTGVALLAEQRRLDLQQEQVDVRGSSNRNSNNNNNVASRVETHHNAATPQSAKKTLKRKLPLSSSSAITKRQKISFEKDNKPESIEGGLSMALETDKKHLSNYQILMRQCFEFFPASKEDVETKVQGRRKIIELRQVGIRCKFCADIVLRFRGKAAVYYPQKLSGVYQAAQNMTVTHLIKHCMSIDQNTRQELDKQRQIRDYVGGGKKYWIEACHHIGLVEKVNGIWFEPNAEDSKLPANETQEELRSTCV